MTELNKDISYQITNIRFDKDNSEAVANMLVDLILLKPVTSYEGYEELSIVNEGFEYVIKFQFIHEWNREDPPYDEIIHQQLIIDHLQIYDTEGNRIKYTCDSDIEDIIKEAFTF